MKLFKTQKIILFKTEAIAKIKNKVKIPSKSKKLFITKNIKQEINKIPTCFLKEKRDRFHVEKIIEKNLKEGRWNQNEEIQFFKALDKYGVNWKKIADEMTTRTNNQIRSHAQKFFKKLKKFQDNKLGIDLTLNTIKNLKDVLAYIKSINNDYDIYNILLYISKCLYEKKTSRKKKLETLDNKNNIFKVDSNVNNINNNFNVYNMEKVTNEGINLQQDLYNIINQQNINNYLINDNLTSYMNNVNYLNILINNYLNNSIAINFMNTINFNILYNHINNLNNNYENNIQNYSLDNNSINNNNNI